MKKLRQLLLRWGWLKPKAQPYPIVELDGVQYYRTGVDGSAMLNVQRDLVDSGLTTVEAEILALRNPR